MQYYIDIKICELFEPSRIESLLVLVEQLLQQLVSLAPETYTSHLDLLPATQQDFLRRCNMTSCDYPEALTLQTQFENQVEKTPNNTALIAEGGVALSYRELNQLSNRLGHYLRKQYVIEADDRIGICCDRSEHLLIGVLGALKAGAAYIPLDASHPDKRLMYLLSDIDAKVVLTNKRYADRLKALLSMTQLKTAILSLDEEVLESMLLLESADNPELINSSRDLAYIIYTSGTTGKPKGVMIEHRGLTNRCYWQYQQFPYHVNEVCCCRISLNFVDHAAEIFAPLLAGRTLVLMGAYVLPSQLDLSQLVAKIKEHKITRLVVVPSLLGLLLDWQDETMLSTLRYCFCSGEVLSAALVKKCKARFPQLTLINIYGASEVNADVSYSIVSGSDPLLRPLICEKNIIDELKAQLSIVCKLTSDANQSAIAYLQARLQCLTNRMPGIGRPLNNSALYVLNAQLKLLPIGVAGELYVAGDVLSRGYWNSPEMTNTRFITNPFQSKLKKTSDSYARLYKTGDWVRWREDGELEFVGRNDSQIKIRGMRLNLLEVQAALDDCDGVKESVVFPCSLLQPATSEPKLVAYYIASSQLKTEVIQAKLKQKLPDYMIPDYFIPIKLWPLNANGKLDCEALPKPVLVRQTVLAPRNKIERDVLKCFSLLLDLPESQIGIDQNFFNLGGNSILAIKLYHQIIHHFGEQCIQMSLLLSDVSVMAISKKIEGDYQQEIDGEIIEF